MIVAVAALEEDAVPGLVAQEGCDGEELSTRRLDELLRGEICAPMQEQSADAVAMRRSSGLVAACRDLNDLNNVGDTTTLLGAIPRLSLDICSARGAQLWEIDAYGTTSVLASHGAPFLKTAQPVTTSISIPRAEGLRLVLVLEREPGAAFQPAELSELEVFTFMSASALARAALNAELQASQAIETVLVGAVHESVIALDANGVVRALSGSAAMLIGQRRSDAIGKRLRDLPGLAPLSLALDSSDRCPETVQLATGEVRLRLRRCEAGLAVTLTAIAGSASRLGGAQYGISGARYEIDNLLGDSPLIRRARETALRVADLNVPILITGETGTGKEILAQAIHNASSRANEPFVGVNVSAIPRELLESELFGYEPGAFTGACAQGNPGKFEMAQNGTLLLDEVGEMPLEMQAKLLRVLQERAVQRLGGSHVKEFTGRIIASTNRDLEVEVAAGRFRLDLLHRLRVVQVQLPPLRERGNDIRLLVDQQLRAHAKATKRAVQLAPEVMAVFEAYSWPGNVRELVNMVEGELSLLPAGKNVIDVIPDVIERSNRRIGTPALSDSMTLESAEREACVRALGKAEGNVARAAQILGVVKATLYSKIRLYGLEQPKADRSGRPRSVASRGR
jgi:transcriptional regulator with PAS, ATPase and Fis domain